MYMRHAEALYSLDTARASIVRRIRLVARIGETSHRTTDWCLDFDKKHVSCCMASVKVRQSMAGIAYKSAYIPCFYTVLSDKYCVISYACFSQSCAEDSGYPIKWRGC